MPDMSLKTGSNQRRLARAAALLCGRFHRLGFLLSTLSILAIDAASVNAVSPELSRGKALYANLCVECHGKQGEGVKGKYREALRGSWSLDKLARVIDRTMPDGAPEKCVGEEARAVARYIYETFYHEGTPAAGPRPRLELAHLTNLQFINSAADLLRAFEGEPSVGGGMGGLKATYYNARGFNGDKKVIERVDASVDFDYGSGSPDSRVGPEEFSMQWRGSLRTPETGVYEFVLRTPNGARLWLNDNDEPAVDAWVASAGVEEHRFTRRLLANRSYPIKLDFFKFKDKTARVSLLWKPPGDVLRVIPGHQLSSEPARPAFVPQTAFPADDSSSGYERGVAISKAWDDAVTRAASEAADAVVRRLDGFTKSKPTDPDRSIKARQFCLDWVSLAVRRPLTKEDRNTFVEGHFLAGVTAEDAVRRVVIHSLKSPEFLYPDLNRQSNDGAAVAARLSYALWDSTPDRSLLASAASGRLDRREGLLEEAQRLSADPRALNKAMAFLHHWLRLDQAELLAKDAQVYAGFTPEILSDLRSSLNLFLQEAAWGKTSDFRRLLLSDELFVNQRLARFYSLSESAAPTNGFAPVRVDRAQRSGVVTHPYVLTAFAYPKSSSPIHRGVFLARNVLGRTLRPPPMATAFKDDEFPKDLTMREKVARLTEPKQCQSCHVVINPAGFALEAFDGVGRWRERDNGKPVDTLVEYLTEDGEKLRWRSGRDLAEHAAGNESGQRVFVEQMFQYLTKQPVGAYGSEVLTRLHKSFVDSGFDVRRLAIEISLATALPETGGSWPASRPVRKRASLAP